MPPETRLSDLDLLVVGGLTVDSFPDGSRVAGGSVLHATRAAADAGHRAGVVATAGPEPEVVSALAELATLASVLAQPVERSIHFEHRSADGARQLRFLGAGAPLAPASVGVSARAVLLAPVAAELGAGLRGLCDVAGTRAAILQGWLRWLEPGEVVAPRPLADLDAALREALSDMDLLIASREDLAADADEPEAQLDALRAAFGKRPVLVVTDSVDGAWLDAGDRWRVPVPRRVDVPSVGAGDMFAALLVAPGWPDGPDRDFLSRRAVDAMRGVAELLSRRR